MKRVIVNSKWRKAEFRNIVTGNRETGFVLDGERFFAQVVKLKPDEWEWEIGNGTSTLGNGTEKSAFFAKLTARKKLEQRENQCV